MRERYQLHAHDHLVVFGQSSPVLAHWDSSSLLKCESPPSREEGLVTISVMSEHAVFRSHAAVSLLPRPRLHALRPLSGPNRGGTAVTLHGEGFGASSADRCFFGNIMVIPKRTLATGGYECVSPTVPSPVSVRVSINQDASFATQYFHYTPESAIHRLRPLHGPVEGGTEVELAGIHFLLGVAAICTFNATSTAATVASSVLARCIAPRHYGHVAVEISTGDELSHSHVQFEYLSAIFASIFSQWTNSGKHDILVTGSRFSALPLPT